MTNHAKRQISVAIAALLLLSSASGPGAEAAQRPPETSVAGRSILKAGQGLLKDSRTGAYLVSTVECDGAHRWLSLSRDLRPFAHVVEYLKPVKTVRLPNLRTGRGILLGDRPERVRRIMGKPSWTGGSRTTPGETVWSYRHRKGTEADGVEHRVLFRFRNGAVTCVEIHRDLLPGC